MSEKPTLKQILPQLQSWCAVNNVSVQSVYDQCHGMTLQEIVYYLFGVVKQASEEVVDYEGQFKELYNYVHDYFDNLDVQQEINNKLDEMTSNGELGNILQTIIPIGQPIFVNSASEMVNHNALYVLTTDGMIYTWSGSAFTSTGLIYGSPDNVLINQLTTTLTSFAEIDTIGYTRITSDVYQAMTDKDGLPDGAFSGVLLNLNHAFNDAYIRFQQLLLYSGSTGYLTYNRFFNYQSSPQGSSWTNVTVSTETLINYSTTDATSFAEIDTIGYTRITSDVYQAMTDKDGLPDGAFSGVLLNLNHAFNDAYIRFQQLLLYSGSTGYLTYNRFFNYQSSPQGSSWTNVTPNINTKNIVYIALGDSRTNGKTTNYPEIIRGNLGYDVTNLGSSGSSIMPVDGHTNLYNIVNSNSFAGADVISIMYGRNDYILNNPLGTYLDTDNSSVMGYLYQSIIKILNDAPACNIVIFSPFNDFSRGTSPNYAKNTPNTAGYTLLELCEELESFCTYYQIKYVNLIDTFPSIINLNNIPDGIHLTDDSGLASIVASEIY